MSVEGTWSDHIPFDDHKEEVVAQAGNRAHLYGNHQLIVNIEKDKQLNSLKVFIVSVCFCSSSKNWIRSTQ